MEARKTVTVVFADVVGSTSMGERLDPESVRRLMARYFDDMRSIIERHGGTVEKFIGDAVMAVFGVPATHEDDALRACRAAAGMQEAAARLDDDFTGFRIRIGINTGEVVAGDPSTGQALVTGDAVNVAARLEQASDPGQILLGRETFRLVRDAVRAEEVPALEAKGKARPVGAYRLTDVIPGAAPFARRLDSPLVGRRGELDALRGVLVEAEQEPACRLVTVIGEAGAGKSRLVTELLAGAGDAATILTGRCLPYGEGITFWPIAEALKAHAGITEQDSPEEARARIVGMLGSADDAALLRERVLAAIGLGEEAGELQETFWAFRRLLETVAAEGPLILLVEDIHWAESTLLDLLQYVAGFSTGRPILLLCTARPELRDQRPDWDAATRAVVLRPLTDAQSGELIANLLGRAGLPEEIRARVSAAAEGNPLFVEEMLRMLIDDGLLVHDDGYWRQAGDLSEVAVPGTIHALLSARLDRLEEAERTVIQRASVVGRVFYWGAVAALTPEDARAEVGTHLQTLLRKELVGPDRSMFAGEDALRFSHILVRDAAYESMPKRDRADHHERFAAWLADKAADRIAEYEEILGYHLEQAYRYRATLAPSSEAGREVARAAAGRLASAGRRALRRGDMPAAVNLLGRAADLMEADDRTRPPVLVDFATALTDVGDLARADDVVSEAAQAAAAIGDRRVEWHAKVQSLWLRGVRDTGRFWDWALTETDHAIHVFEELGDDTGLARAWMIKTEMFNDLAQRGNMAEAARQALEHARRAGDRREEALCARLLAGSFIYGPTPVSEGIPRCEVILHDAADSPMVQAAMLPVLGQLLGMDGRFQEARGRFERARTLNQDLGLRFFSARMTLLSGDVELLAGDPVAAERESRAGCEIFKEMGETGRFSTLASVLAHALYQQGRDDEALVWTEEAEGTSAPDDVVSHADWRRVRAKVMARRGEAATAEDLMASALRIAERSPDDVHLHSKVLQDAAETMLLLDRRDEALAHARRALEVAERKGNRAAAARIRALIEELGEPRADSRDPWVH